MEKIGEKGRAIKEKQVIRPYPSHGQSIQPSEIERHSRRIQLLWILSCMSAEDSSMLACFRRLRLLNFFLRLEILTYYVLSYYGG